MKPAPTPADIDRLVALAEEGLRRNGLTERTIREGRKATRAQIEAYLLGLERR